MEDRHGNMRSSKSKHRILLEPTNTKLIKLNKTWYYRVSVHSSLSKVFRRVQNKFKTSKNTATLVIACSVLLCLNSCKDSYTAI